MFKVFIAMSSQKSSPESGRQRATRQTHEPAAGPGSRIRDRSTPACRLHRRADEERG